jgi:hypothetical protein
MAIASEVFFDIRGDVRATARVRRETNDQPQSLNASIPDGDTIGFHMGGSRSA